MACALLFAAPLSAQGRPSWFAVLRDTTKATRDTVRARLIRDGADSSVRFVFGVAKFTTADSTTARMAMLTQTNAWAPWTTAAGPEFITPLDTLPTNVVGILESNGETIPWGVVDVHAPEVWAMGDSGTGVKIGIMDTGVDIAHPDLHVVGGFDFTTNSALPSAYTNTQASCEGHGTHVAGIAAAKQNGLGVVGVAPGADLYSLKVFIDYGSGCFAYGSAEIAALQWAVANHLDVVNISIGNTYSLAYANAVTAATAAGVVIVAATGNTGGLGVVFPAAYPGAVGVGALTSNHTRASYSTYGPEEWVSAPGSGITSTLPGGGYGNKDGTSMASPHVAGVVALIRHQARHLTVDSIRAILCIGSRPVVNGGCGDLDVHAIFSWMIANGVIPTASVTPQLCAAGTTCTGCFDAIGHLVDAVPSVSWLTVTSIVGQRLCWSASPPLGSSGSLTLTLRSL
jgi:subtilisin